MFIYVKLDYLYIIKNFKIFDNTFNYSTMKLFYFYICNFNTFSFIKNLLF